MFTKIKDYLKKNVSVLLFASAMLILGAGMAFSQEICAEGRDYDTVTQRYKEASGASEYTELKSEFVDHFKAAWAEVTGNSVPEGTDLVQVFPVPSAGVALLVAYKEKCALGAATVDVSLLEQVLQKMRQNRAQN